MLFATWSILTEKQRQLLLELIDAIWNTPRPHQERRAFLWLKNSPCQVQEQNYGFYM